MTLYRKRNPESPRDKQQKEKAVTNTANDWWLVALGPRSCDTYKWNQYCNLIHPVISDKSSSVWLMEMVVVINKCEIGTGWTEMSRTRRTRKIGRGRQVTWNNPDSRSLPSSAKTRTVYWRRRETKTLKTDTNNGLILFYLVNIYNYLMAQHQFKKIGQEKPTLHLLLSAAAARCYGNRH